MQTTATLAPARTLQVGRTFVSPLFDTLLIGGGLTFPLALWLWWDGASAAAFIGLSLPVFVLLVNQAHFAASTVRLYTKPGTFDGLPFLTMAFPIVTLVAISACVVFADSMGRHLWALYATWSPFHYAAQTFGLASMYCYRSGCTLTAGERRLLRATCLMPFFASFLGAAGVGYGLGWFVSTATIASSPLGFQAFHFAHGAFRVLTFALPVVLFVWVGSRARSAPPGEARPGVPLISLLLIVSNGIWWVVFNYIDAFIWATIFHGLQYLAIVTIFHVRERAPQPGTGGRGPLYHVVTLYAMCVGLGYLLFQCWPRAYMLLGYGKVESIFLVVAAINVHHFIVDGFIWKIRRDRPNYATVVGDGP